MKKIVIIDSNLDVMGGVERIINTLANNLSKDNQVTVISNFKRRSNTFYTYNDNVEYMSVVDESYTFTSKQKSINYYLKRIIEKYKEKHLCKYLTTLMEERISTADVLIFGRVASFNLYAKYLERISIKAKIIVRDAIHLDYFNAKTKAMIKKYFPKFVDTFIVSSTESINKYKQFLGDIPINIVKIYNPLGIVPKIKYTYSNKTVVSLGRMDKVDQKGFKNLILAFNYIRRNYPDWKLKIYGNGLGREDLMNVISANDLSNCVELIESTKNVVDVLNKSSIYVMASRFEGYANMLVEAMSCGIPSISYDWLMGVDDIIDDGVNGTIVKLQDRHAFYQGETLDEDVRNLANAIIELIRNKKKCDMYSKNASKIISTRNCDLIINEWEKLIIG